MGDRALVQVTDGRGLDDGGEISPVLYLHWSGSSVPEILAGLSAQMASRGPDVFYTFARLVGRACNQNGGNGEALSVGVWNAFTDDAGMPRLLTPDDSHGDAGVFVLNVRDRIVYYGGGYAPEWQDAFRLVRPLSEHPYTWVEGDACVTS